MTFKRRPCFLNWYKTNFILCPLRLHYGNLMLILVHSVPHACTNPLSPHQREMRLSRILQNSAWLNWQTIAIRSIICLALFMSKILYLELIFNLVLILAKRSGELSLLYIQRPIFKLLTADKDEIKNNFEIC